MKCIVKYNFQDYYEFQKIHFKKRSGVKYLRFIGILLLILIPIVHYTLYVSLALILFAIIIIFYSQTLVRLLSWSLYRRAWNLKYPITYEISEEGVRNSSEINSGMTKWSAFQESVFTENVILLYYSYQGMTAFHHRHFNNKQWEELTMIIKKNIPRNS